MQWVHRCLVLYYILTPTVHSLRNKYPLSFQCSLLHLLFPLRCVLYFPSSLLSPLSLVYSSTFETPVRNGWPEYTCCWTIHDGCFEFLVSAISHCPHDLLPLSADQIKRSGQASLRNDSLVLLYFVYLFGLIQVIVLSPLLSRPWKPFISILCYIIPSFPVLAFTTSFIPLFVIFCLCFFVFYPSSDSLLLPFLFNFIHLSVFPFPPSFHSSFSLSPFLLYWVRRQTSKLVVSCF